jgi:hypothetical protein
MARSPVLAVMWLSNVHKLQLAIALDSTQLRLGRNASFASATKALSPSFTSHSVTLDALEAC